MLIIPKRVGYKLTLHHLKRCYNIPDNEKNEATKKEIKFKNTKTL